MMDVGLNWFLILVEEHKLMIAVNSIPKRNADLDKLNNSKLKNTA
jgi:hypothetical protein